LVECREHIFWGSRTKAPYFLSFLFSQNFVPHGLDLPCHPLRWAVGAIPVVSPAPEACAVSPPDGAL
jgi:hypothetical protein